MEIDEGTNDRERSGTLGKCPRRRCRGFLHRTLAQSHAWGAEIEVAVMISPRQLRYRERSRERFAHERDDQQGIVACPTRGEPGRKSGDLTSEWCPIFSLDYKRHGNIARIDAPQRARSDLFSMVGG